MTGIHGGDIPGWQEDKAKKFRWTRMRASLPIAECRLRNADCGKQEAQRAKGTAHGSRSTEDEWEIYLLCSHPDIEKEPVVVRILENGRVIREEQFGCNGWKRVVLRDKDLDGAAVLTFQVSRTWNPKVMGVSEDGRDLGVAAAFF